MRSYVPIVWFPVMALSTHVACAASDRQRPDVREIVRTSGTAAEVKERLSEVPSDTVIAALVDVIANDPDFHDPTLRGRAYQALVDRHAETSPAGLKQLEDCLIDERFRGVCSKALENTPVEFRDEVVASLAKAIENTDQVTSSLAPVLRALGTQGATAAAAVPTVEGVFRNPALEPKLRGAAAWALTRISGAAEALPVLMNDADAEIHLWPLAAVDTDKKDAYALDAASRELLEGFVLKMMRSPDKRVRETAFESAFLAFDGDFVHGNGTDGYFVNLKFRSAIEYMAENEPDEGLRTRAKSVADTLDGRLRNAVRRLENPDKYAPK